MSSITYEYHRVNRIEPGSALEDRWFSIFKQFIVGELSIEDARLRSAHTYQIDLIFIKENGEDVGLSMVSYFQATFDKQKVYFVRPIVGIIKKARGSKFPSKQFGKQLVEFKLRHPARQVVVYGNLNNPLIYAASCKYWDKTYPKDNVHYSDKIKQLREVALKYFGQEEIRENIVKGYFTLQIEENDRKRFIYEEGKNRHVDLFMSLNPNYFENECLVVLAPVSWRNVIGFVKNAVFG